MYQLRILNGCGGNTGIKNLFGESSKPRRLNERRLKHSWEPGNCSRNNKADFGIVKQISRVFTSTVEGAYLGPLVLSLKVAR